MCVYIKYVAVINILCDVIADTVDGVPAHRSRQTFASYARICGTRKLAAE